MMTHCFINSQDHEKIVRVSVFLFSIYSVFTFYDDSLHTIVQQVDLCCEIVTGDIVCVCVCVLLGKQITNVPLSITVNLCKATYFCLILYTIVYIVQCFRIKID